MMEQHLKLNQIYMKIENRLLNPINNIKDLKTGRVTP